VHDDLTEACNVFWNVMSLWLSVTWDMCGPTIFCYSTIFMLQPSVVVSQQFFCCKNPVVIL
jgi:hypothetical protein